MYHRKRNTNKNTNQFMIIINKRIVLKITLTCENK